MSNQDQKPARWQILDDVLLRECRVWDLRQRRYRHPVSGKEGDFFYIDSRDWAVVVARTESGAFVLVRQFRWGSDALSWELPGGIVDEGEDPVAAGLRELREETGGLGGVPGIERGARAVEIGLLAHGQLSRARIRGGRHVGQGVRNGAAARDVTRGLAQVRGRGQGSEIAVGG